MTAALTVALCALAVCLFAVGAGLWWSAWKLDRDDNLHHRGRR